MKRIIGITGYARHGKDTVADIVAERGYKKVAFADSVRDMALAIDPWIPVVYYNDNNPDVARLSALVEQHGWEAAKDLYPGVREFLVRMGTNGVRDIVGSDSWIVALASREHVYDSKPPLLVISDVRFINEAEWIRALGGEVWRVHRGRWRVLDLDSPGDDDWIPFDNGVEADSDAEREVPQIYADLEIRNDSTVEALQRKVRKHIDNLTNSYTVATPYTTNIAKSEVWLNGNPHSWYYR